jgi:monoamine oxidase
MMYERSFTKEEDRYINRSSIKGGNGMLPERIANSLGPRLNLNKCLKQVSKNTDGFFILTFDNGYKVQADLLYSPYAK